MILLFKTYYVFWNSISFGMTGMQYRAIGCSVTLLLAILHLINTTFQVITLPENPRNLIIVSFTIFYILGTIIVNSNKERLLKYDMITNREQLTHILLAIVSIPFIIWPFRK